MRLAARLHHQRAGMTGVTARLTTWGGK